MKKRVDNRVCFVYSSYCSDAEQLTYATVAQLVEYDLAKVGVAGSNPVVRSTKPRPPDIDPAGFFMPLAYSGQIPAYRTRSPCSRDTSAAGSPPMAGALQRLVNLPVPAG